MPCGGRLGPGEAVTNQGRPVLSRLDVLHTAGLAPEGRRSYYDDALNESLTNALSQDLW
jgi:hypothetical protein